MGDTVARFLERVRNHGDTTPITDLCDGLTERQARGHFLTDSQAEDVPSRTRYLDSRNPEEIVLGGEPFGGEAGFDRIVICDCKCVEPDRGSLFEEEIHRIPSIVAGLGVGVQLDLQHDPGYRGPRQKHAGPKARSREPSHPDGRVA
jgi:hypothetical protein